MELNENVTVIFKTAEEKELYNLLISWYLESLYTTLRGKSLLCFNVFYFNFLQIRRYL